MKSIKSMFEEIENTVVEDTNATVKEVLPFMSSKVEEELDYAAKYHELENILECPLDVIIKVLVENKPILVLNPITKSIQEIPNPCNFYIPKRYAFDIRCENFEDTYWKSNIWKTGGAFFYLKDYKKTWWLLDKEKSE